MNALRNGLPAAGLFAGPLAWMVNTEANYSLVPTFCTASMAIVPLVALVMVVVSLMGAALSWRAWQHQPKQPSSDDSAAALPLRLLAGIGMGAGVLFAAIITMQAAAALIVPGCQ